MWYMYNYLNYVTHLSHTRDINISVCLWSYQNTKLTVLGNTINKLSQRPYVPPALNLLQQSIIAKEIFNFLLFSFWGEGGGWGVGLCIISPIKGELFTCTFKKFLFNAKMKNKLIPLIGFFSKCYEYCFSLRYNYMNN